MAQLGILLAILVVFAGYGWKMFSWGEESGLSQKTAEVMEIKNDELADLNQKNVAMQDTIDEERRENIDYNMELEEKHRRQIKDVKLKSDIAMDEYSTAMRMQLDEAENRGKDRSATQESGSRAFISGLAGTEGSKLTPKTRYDLEQLSLYGDTSALLLELCAATDKRDRGIE